MAVSVITSQNFCRVSPHLTRLGVLSRAAGGDNSNWARGTFYEGIIALGVTTAATDDAIQENIVAVGYKTGE